jgi:hypothetical protein
MVQASLPYRRIAMMYVCNTCFLVSNDNVLLYKILFHLRKVALACATLLLTSVLHLASVVIVVPLYIKPFTCVNVVSSPSIMHVCCLSFDITIISNFF